jgi:hypothetical protein
MNYETLTSSTYIPDTVSSRGLIVIIPVRVASCLCTVTKSYCRAGLCDVEYCSFPSIICLPAFDLSAYCERTSVAACRISKHCPSEILIEIRLGEAEAMWLCTVHCLSPASETNIQLLRLTCLRTVNNQYDEPTLALELTCCRYHSTHSPGRLVWSEITVRKSSAKNSSAHQSGPVRNAQQKASRFLSPLLVSTICHFTFVYYADKLISNAGGGGERVLWTAIAALQRTEPDMVSVVYSGDVDSTKEDIIATVKVRTSNLSDPMSTCEL